jgi:TolA-binding protein
VVAPVAARAVEVVKLEEVAAAPVAEVVATPPVVPVPVTAPVLPRVATSPAAVQPGESARAVEDQPREEPTPAVAPRASESESALESDGEVTLLQRAMGAAQAGDSTEALAHALAHAARYPNSSMAQEREVIAIEALAALGRSEEAQARIGSFRMRWPTSTHLLRLERAGR